MCSPDRRRQRSGEINNPRAGLLSLTFTARTGCRFYERANKRNKSAAATRPESEQWRGLAKCCTAPTNSKVCQQSAEQTTVTVAAQPLSLTWQEDS
jgi:hypothetical protein